MPNRKSEYVVGQKNMPSPMGSELVNVVLQDEIPIVDLASGDLLILGEIPEDCVLVDAVYFADELDSGTALLLDFGTINAGETDLDVTIEAGITVGQAAATAARMVHTVANLNILGGISGEPIGFKVATIPTGAQAGTLGVSLTYRAEYDGD